MGKLGDAVQQAGFFFVNLLSSTKDDLEKPLEREGCNRCDDPSGSGVQLRSIQESWALFAPKNAWQTIPVLTPKVEPPATPAPQQEVEKKEEKKEEPEIAPQEEPEIGPAEEDDNDHRIPKMDKLSWFESVSIPSCLADVYERVDDATFRDAYEWAEFRALSQE